MLSYYNNFVEVDRLIDTKAQFARPGIPDCLITDNVPQFVSDNFRKFTKDWQFQLITFSPGERSKDSETSDEHKPGSDLWLSLLAFWNTPTNVVGSSPAQCLFSHHTKTLLPTTAKLLQPSVTKEAYSRIVEQKTAQAKTYNQHAKPLADLRVGATVCVQPIRDGSCEWVKARVKKVLPNNSFDVQTENGQCYYATLNVIC